MTNLVTPEEVADLVNLSTDADQIALAQFVVATWLGGIPTVLSTSDLELIRQAVVWEVLFLDKHPEVLTSAGNLKAAATNGTSVTYKDDPDGELSVLSPLALTSLRRVSWVRSTFITTLHASLPVQYRPQPDPWVRL